MPAREETARRFGRLSRGYAESPGHARGPDLQIVVNFLDPEPDMLVLDVATGAGHTAFAAAPRVRHVVASDLSIGMVREARRLTNERAIGNVSFVVTDVESLAFPDRTFDAVTCRIAAHHFLDARRSLSEIARVLKPAGRFVLEDSTSPEEPALERFLSEVETLRDPTHVRSWSESAWRTMLAEAGLSYQWGRIYRKRHDIAAWLSRAEADGGRKEAVLRAFETASPTVRDYFEIEFDGGRASSFTDDKLILRAERTG